MTTRKTIAVEDIKFWVNNILAHDEKEISGMVAGLSPEQAYRLATAAILEAALHKTSQYKGYQYIDSAKAMEPNGDKTRRRYY
jgi:hypothetical protein